MAAIISHRGGALLWPENSRCACVNTVRLGVEQLQVDVHLSRDGELVIIHDATLDRTTDGTGPVALHDWADLQRLRLIGGAEGPPLRLQEVIDIVDPSPLTLRLEIKRRADGLPYARLAERLQKVLDRTNFAQRTIISAFHTDSLAPFVGQTKLAWLIDSKTAAAQPTHALAEQASFCDIETLGFRWSSVDEHVADVLVGSGTNLCCFGCNDAAGIDFALMLGAAEISTDRPDLALQRRDVRKGMPRLPSTGS